MIGWLERHRGPFLFCVTRLHVSKAGRVTSEWLPGEVVKDDCETEATALLTDPRDTITAVDVWSVKEEQFVGVFK